IITFTPGRDSGTAATLADLPDFTSAGFTADFDSDFLVVTGAFDCTGADFAATFGNGFTGAFVATDFGAGLDVVLGVTLGCALVTFAATFTAFFAGATGLALLAVLVAVVFFIAGFAADLGEVDLAAVGLAFFSVCTRGFAGFFIAFAIEFLPIKLLFLHSQSHAL
ncbi:MAG: hypothetical protein ACXWJK_09965, partial [Burkholderiaceae bacterium]